MRIFLTGATGFIGSHVTRQLVENGNEVSVLIRESSSVARIADLIPRLHIVRGSLSDSDAWAAEVKRCSPDVCLHLAWYTKAANRLDTPDNATLLQDSIRLLPVLEDAGCRRLVFAGTLDEYKFSDDKLSESDPIMVPSLYAACKYSFQLVAEQFMKRFGGTAASARIFHVYGPHEDPSRVVPYIILNLLRGTPCALTSGHQIRDYSHVHDVASGICAIARSDVTGPINVGSGLGTAVSELAMLIADAMQRRDLLRLGAIPNRPNEPARFVANVGRLRTLTDWTPKYDLKSGLLDTIAWWKLMEGDSRAAGISNP